MLENKLPTPTLEQLQALYPGCPELVAFGETSYADQWPIARQFDLQTVMSVLKQTSQAWKERFTALGLAVPAETASRLFVELDHPDAIKYVRAKLGSV